MAAGCVEEAPEGVVAALGTDGDSTPPLPRRCRAPAPLVFPLAVLLVPGPGADEAGADPPDPGVRGCACAA